jgi:hypothetical protein
MRDSPPKDARYKGRFTMAYDVHFLIEYSLPQDIAEVLSENLIAFDPDSDDEGCRSPSRRIARSRAG